MNLTDHLETTGAEQFFFEVLEPLAKKLHRDKKPIYFHKGPHPVNNTYFVRRSKVSMDPSDFETGGCSSSEDIKKALVDLWGAEGNNDLSIMADAIVQLAELTHQSVEQTDEVSPFMYVMF